MANRGGTGGGRGGGETRHTIVLDLDDSRVNEKLQNLQRRLSRGVEGAGDASQDRGGSGPRGGGGAGGAMGGGRGGGGEFATAFAIQQIQQIANTAKDAALLATDPYATSMQRSMGQTQGALQTGAGAVGAIAGGMMAGPMGAMAGGGLGSMFGDLVSGLMSNEQKAEMAAQESLRSVFEREEVFRVQHGLDPLTDTEASAIRNELKPMFDEMEAARQRAAEHVGDGPDLFAQGGAIDNLSADILGAFGSLFGILGDWRETGQSMQQDVRAMTAALVNATGINPLAQSSQQNEQDAGANGRPRMGN